MEDLWKKMDREQFEQFLAHRERLMELPGVRLIVPELEGIESRELAISVYLDANHASTIHKLPGELLGVPIVVKLEDAQSGQLQDVVRLGP